VVNPSAEVTERRTNGAAADSDDDDDVVWSGTSKGAGGGGFPRTPGTTEASAIHVDDSYSDRSALSAGSSDDDIREIAPPTDSSSSSSKSRADKGKLPSVAAGAPLLPPAPQMSSTSSAALNKQINAMNSLERFLTLGKSTGVMGAGGWVDASDGTEAAAGGGRSGGGAAAVVATPPERRLPPSVLPSNKTRGGGSARVHDSSESDSDDSVVQLERASASAKGGGGAGKGKGAARKGGGAVEAAPDDGLGDFLSLEPKPDVRENRKRGRDRDTPKRSAPSGTVKGWALVRSSLRNYL
jgi:hypothetical protein